jgi:hypothetical protein
LNYKRGGMRRKHGGEKDSGHSGLHTAQASSTIQHTVE